MQTDDDADPRRASCRARASTGTAGAASRARRAGSYLCIALVVTSAAAAPTPDLARHLARGQLRQAHRLVLTQLSTDPDNADLMGIYGAVLARAGCAADAEAAFSLAAGSAWVEQQGLALRADALRDLGAVEQAAELRGAVLLAGVHHPGWEAQVWMEQAEDELERGRWDEAAALTEQAIAWYPPGGLPWAARARVALEAGALAEAEEALWMANRMADRPLGLAALVEAGLLLAAGAPLEAEALLHAQPTARGSDLRLWVLRAEIARQKGDPAEALRILDDERFHWSAAPVLTEARVRALWELGRTEEAASALAEAQARAPGSARLADLALEAHLRDELSTGHTGSAAARWRQAAASDPLNRRRAALGARLGLR